jgi:membrane protein implicated in regulation of membrane protease activity
MDKFFISHFILWVIVAAVFATLEVLLTIFGFILVAGSAVIAAFCALAGTNIVFQVVVFVVTMILSLIFLRPRLIKRLHTTNKILGRAEKLFGQDGEVTEDIHLSAAGRVLINGEDWAAKAKENISRGSKIKVTGADGIVLIVEKVD